MAYLECDVGQSEFTLPGVVSLFRITEPVFGPPCAHLRRPEKQVAVGVFVLVLYGTMCRLWIADSLFLFFNLFLLYFLCCLSFCFAC